jgi:hypothetical protein
MGGGGDKTSLTHLKNNLTNRGINLYSKGYKLAHSTIEYLQNSPLLFDLFEERKWNRELF